MVINGIGAQHDYVQVHTVGAGGFYSSSDRLPVFWNNSTQQLEVLVNNTFQPIPSSHVYVSLPPDVVDVIEWAKERKAEHKRLDELCQSHPTLANLKDQFEMTLALVR